MQRAGQRLAQRLIGTGLELAGTPATPYGRATQCVQQDRLAYAAQSSQHYGPLRSALTDALEQDVEGCELRVTSRKLRRPLSRTRRVRIADRIHDRTVFGYLAHLADFRILRHRVAPLGSVRISVPSAVTAMVCSHCATQEPSWVSTVQPSSQMYQSMPPRVIIGSMVKDIPGSSSSVARGSS